MENDILTTSEMAKLLGVSVRTAQLLIEGGALTSWKTPGGHRRVYRADVLAFMAGRNATPAIPSARVVLLASAERLAMFETVLAAVGGCSLEAYTDPVAASFAMGERAPAVVIADMTDEASKRASFLEYVALNPALRQTKLIVFGALSSDEADLVSSRLHAHVTHPHELANTIRTALQDVTKSEDLFPMPPTFPVAVNERQRLAAVERSGLMAMGREEIFDQLTWLTSYSLKAPIALVTTLTATHQLFKSRHGLALTKTPRSWAFCNYTILQRGVFTVGDLSRDARFAGNPAVASAPHFRFYAGAPVIDIDGFALASLCIIDYEPRRLDSDQTQTLQLLANFAASEVRTREPREMMSIANA